MSAFVLLIFATLTMAHQESRSDSPLAIFGCMKGVLEKVCSLYGVKAPGC